HNLHALRIVEDFESRYAGFRGLNLTYEVREGIIKHSRDYDAEQYPELAEYRMREQPPIEAQLIDLTDEIAYASADLDDGYEAHILSLAEIRSGVGIFDRAYAGAMARYPQAPEKLLFNEALRRMLDAMVTDLISATASNAAQTGANSLEQVRAHPRRVAGFSPEMDELRRQAK